ncbi:hypothetical protein B566_EDAN000974 [Ephemera danica]|nr:hypothetical protein B566_EDAN000974 [Ephemera danica]
MAQNEAVLQQIATSNAEFSRKFYKVLQAHEGNLVASPLSAQLVLVLAQLGARGRTAEQMKIGLALPEDVETVKTGFHELMKSLTGCEKVILEIANRMYVKTGFGIEADFVAAAEKTFNSTVESVDFVDPAVRTQINKWGPWLHPFNPKHTRPQPFYTDETNSVEVPFMYKKAYFGYASVESLDAEIVELPYEGNQLSLVIVLPKSRTGLAALETKMQDQNLSDLLKNTHSRELELFLPKFKLEVSIKLNDYLKQMGMTDMFGDSADFSGISPVHLQVSHVLQKAFIEVSEEGTEAAAATGVFIRARMLPMDPPPVVQIDRSFFFFLLQRKPALTVLFNGRLHNPLQS